MSGSRINKIEIENFKRISNTLTIELDPITVLVGGNTSGKSSVLQAVQLCVSLLQSVYVPETSKKEFEFRKTVSNDQVSFRPSKDILSLRHGGGASQNKGFSIALFSRIDPNDEKSELSKLLLEVKRGKNANISLGLNHDMACPFTKKIADAENPACIYTPGLSGVAMDEELRSQGALRSSVMQGDANTNLRSLLYQLEHRENGGDKWDRFRGIFSRIYVDASLRTEHDPSLDRYLETTVCYKDQEIPLDLASTGMLQVIQILAYACYFEPLLFLLDEPDSHLHANSQEKLLDALQELTESTHTRILLTTHSPQLVQGVIERDKCKVVWLDEGIEIIDIKDKTAIPTLMSLGMLGSFHFIANKNVKVVLLTEDTNYDQTKIYAIANGAPENIAVKSYNSSGNIKSARQIAIWIHEQRPDMKIVIHRDRDFRTDEELEFERLRFETWKEECSVCAGIEEVFTPLNDIEHGFASIQHLTEVFPKKDKEELQDCVDTAIATKRDDLVMKLSTARNVLKDNMYVDRKKKMPEWKKAAMKNACPKADDFTPKDSCDPFCFESCHGKTLQKALIVQLHKLIGSDSKKVQEQLKQGSTGLIDQKWRKAFS